jgi:hypothetical protein
LATGLLGESHCPGDQGLSAKIRQLLGRTEATGLTSGQHHGEYGRARLRGRLL